MTVITHAPAGLPIGLERDVSQGVEAGGRARNGLEAPIVYVGTAAESLTLSTDRDHCVPRPRDRQQRMRSWLRDDPERADFAVADEDPSTIVARDQTGRGHDD